MILLLKLEIIVGDPKLAAPLWDLRRFFTCYTSPGPEMRSVPLYGYGIPVLGTSGQ